MLYLHGLRGRILPCHPAEPKRTYPAGYFETPANATASSSSPRQVPRQPRNLRLHELEERLADGHGLTHRLPMNLLTTT